MIRQDKTEWDRTLNKTRLDNTSQVKSSRDQKRKSKVESTKIDQTRQE